MSTVAIEINDAGLVVADAQGVLAVEPGYAFIGDGKIATGTTAYANARIHPRQSSNRFWDTLSIEPGSAGIDGVGSAGELAYAQFSSLWSKYGRDRQDCVVLVPGHYGREQLGVLLGIAQEAGVPLRAMVNTAVAAPGGPYPDAQLVYVDASLHRVSVTPLDQSADVGAQSEHSLQGVGLASVTDQLAKRVAELFVLATRFDPFHSAASEQVVYDRLPAWLTALGTGAESVKLTLPHGDEEIAIDIAREQLIGTMSGFYRAIVQLTAQCREPDSALVVLLSDRLAALPGITAALERLDDARVVGLEAARAPLGVLQQLDALGGGGGGIRLLKRLPWRAQATVVRAEPQSEAVPAEMQRAPIDDEETPSHIVYRGTAYGIDNRGVLIGRERAPDRRSIVLNGGQSGVSRAHCELVRRDGQLKLIDMSRFGTFVNEKRVSGEVALRPADVIRIGSPGEQLQVICVEQDSGA